MKMLIDKLINAPGTHALNFDIHSQSHDVMSNNLSKDVQETVKHVEGFGLFTNTQWLFRY